ncbi:MAG: VanZ family protein [Syntrophobacteraceae bacterium]
MRPGSSLDKTLAAMANVCPWVWVAVLYAFQLVGSLVLVGLLNVPMKEVMLPMFFLLLGATSAVVFGLLYEKYNFGPWSYWVPAVIYALVIFSLSNRSYGATSLPFPGDYFHPFEYGVFGIFLCGVWHWLIERRGIMVFCLVVIVCGVVYGISDELHQAFVPGRDCSLFDVSMDTLGLAAGCAAFLTARYAIRSGLGEQGKSTESISE